MYKGWVEETGERWRHQEKTKICRWSGGEEWRWWDRRTDFRVRLRTW